MLTDHFKHWVDRSKRVKSFDRGACLNWKISLNRLAVSVEIVLQNIQLCFVRHGSQGNFLSLQSSHQTGLAARDNISHPLSIAARSNEIILTTVLE